MAQSVHTGSLEPFEPRARSLVGIHPPDDGTDDDIILGADSASEEEIWTIRKDPSGYEELYARGRCVYWTRNSVIVRTYNFTERVHDVFWSRKDVCVALKGGLSIFDSMGEHHQVPLPFIIKNVWHSNKGLIIERKSDPHEESSQPILFGLTRPILEASPIPLLSTSPLESSAPLNSSDHPTSTNGISSSFLQSLPSSLSIVTCYESLPLCIMHSSNEQRHSIWLIRNSSKQEIVEFTKSLLEESTINTSAHTSAYQRRSFNTTNKTNLISTPNQQRNISYLHDNVQEPVAPELTLERIWVDTSSSTAAKGNKSFCAVDFARNKFLVIVIPSISQVRVISYQYSHGNFTFVKTANITAIDAAPIHSQKMMIVLSNDKKFLLYSGCDFITQVTVPSTPTPPNLRPFPVPATPASRNWLEMTPTQMSSVRKRSSMSERSSVGSDLSFQQLYQALSPVPHANCRQPTNSIASINSADIRQIEYVVGERIYIIDQTHCRARFTIPPFSQLDCINRLIEAMRTLVSRDLSLSLISGWYQTRRASVQPEFVLAHEEMRMFKNWFLGIIGLPENFFTNNGTIPESNIRFAYSSPTKKTRRSNRDSLAENNAFLSNAHTLFYAMHLVFEDLLICKLNTAIAESLSELLMVLACLLNLQEYQEYYWLKFPQLQQSLGSYRDTLSNLLPPIGFSRKPAFFKQCPPDVMSFISQLIDAGHAIDVSGQVLSPFPGIPRVTNLTNIIVTLFGAMFNVDPDLAISCIPYGTNDRGDLKRNLLVSKPYRSEMASRRVVELMVNMKKGSSFLSRLPEGLELYLRDAILQCRESPPTYWKEAYFELVDRQDLVSLVSGRARAGRHQAPTKLASKSLVEQCEASTEDQVLQLLFPDDIRVAEAHRMLASDALVEFKVVQRQGATEEEARDETQRHLYLLNIRTMAMPVGRGAIRMRTYSPVIGETFEVPRLELGGRLLPDDRSIRYSHDSSVFPWPYFHNGVAAGLTICASSANNIIDSTWINYNKPRTVIPLVTTDPRDLEAFHILNEHAGFLFALGLNGHLEKLSPMALHDYLCQNNDLTKLAILLGMSAAKRGSRDNNIIKVLSIHVDALLPPNSTELDVPAPVHAASILGVGLLYQGSGDSHISKVLLEEIGRLPGPESNSHVDRESYSLSAGLAFGLVNLCHGGSTTISSSDQLRLYMLGGKRKPLTLAQRERYFKQDCHRGEEEYINTHITSPGGTLGLGLMYHRSSNRSVANWMRAPDTQTLLECVRPDFLILRMLSYGLIMWDHIEPSEQWVESHVPPIVSKHAFGKTSAATSLKTRVDYELMSQSYCNIVAGCCMAVAMRFAGTANGNAYKTIYKHTKMMIDLNDKPALVEQAGRPCIEACLNVLAVSLAVVMVGTGDLGVMRVCRYLRSRLTQSCVFYGSYMATHIALGILFLGSCRYSFSTSPESIGALVCALYPIFPNHCSDNRYHLQALRHLYVLAAEPRLLIPRDIETGRPVYVNVTVTRCDSTTLRLRLPCLMPEINSIESVCVDDDQYWRIEINDRAVLTKCLIENQGYLSVKQKANLSNNKFVQGIRTFIINILTSGSDKSRLKCALNECVQRERVQQFSALSQLSTSSRDIAKIRTVSLRLEQVRIASKLAPEILTGDDDRINLIIPVEGDFAEDFASKGMHQLWCKYLIGETDWVNTSCHVAYYIALNGLKCERNNLGDDGAELVNSLRELFSCDGQ